VLKTGSIIFTTRSYLAPVCWTVRCVRLRRGQSGQRVAHS